MSVLKSSKRARQKKQLTTLQKLQLIIPGLTVEVIKNPAVEFKSKRRAKHLAVKQAAAKLRSRTVGQKMVDINSGIGSDSPTAPLIVDALILQWISSDRAALEHPSYLKIIREEKMALRVKEASARAHLVSSKILNKYDLEIELQRSLKKEKYLWATYKITPQKFQDMLFQQGGGCKICGSTSATKKIGCTRDLVVDHCHESEFFIGSKRAIRGLLCSSCNTRVGSVETKLQEGQLNIFEVYEQVASLKKYSSTELVAFKKYIDECMSIIASLHT